jgi:hypothetical protein
MFCDNDICDTTPFVRQKTALLPKWVDAVEKGLEERSEQ